MDERPLPALIISRPNAWASASAAVSTLLPSRSSSATLAPFRANSRQVSVPIACEYRVPCFLVYRAHPAPQVGRFVAAMREACRGSSAAGAS